MRVVRRADGHAEVDARERVRNVEQQRGAVRDGDDGAARALERGHEVGDGVPRAAERLAELARDLARRVLFVGPEDERKEVLPRRRGRARVRVRCVGHDEHPPAVRARVVGDAQDVVGRARERRRRVRRCVPQRVDDKVEDEVDHPGDRLFSRGAEPAHEPLRRVERIARARRANIGLCAGFWLDRVAIGNPLPRRGMQRTRARREPGVRVAAVAVPRK